MLVRGGGGCPKAVLVSSGVAQNCASKLRVTILLRDPLTIPATESPSLISWSVSVTKLKTNCNCTCSAQKCRGKDKQTFLEDMYV